MTKRLNAVLLIAITILFRTFDNQFIHAANSLASNDANELMSQLSSWSQRLAQDYLMSVDAQKKHYILDDSIYEGYAVVLSCSLTTGTQPIDIAWKWKPTLFETNGAMEITDTLQPKNIKFHIDTSSGYYDKAEQKNFQRSELHLPSATRNASGTYICYDRMNDQIKQTFHMDIQNSSEKTAPSLVFIWQPENKTRIFDIIPSGSSFRLSCNEIIVSGGNSSTVLTTHPPYKNVYKDVQAYYEDAGVSPFSESRLTVNSNHRRNRWFVDIKNASYLDTGEFRCDHLKNPYTAYHYIYVKDKMKKILPSTEIKVGPGDDSKAVIVVLQSNKTQYLGCGPTDPSVTIDLWDSQRRLASSNGITKSDIWAFQAYEGFVLKTASSWDIEGSYTCLTADKNLWRKFRIKVIGIQLNAEHGQHNLTEFDRLVLTCEAKTIEPHYANLTWLWKPLSAAEDFTYLDEKRITNWNCSRKGIDKENNLFFSKIICEKTPLEAAGIFECRDSLLNNNYSVSAAKYKLGIQTMRYQLQPETNKVSLWAYASLTLLVLPLILVLRVIYRRRKKVSGLGDAQHQSLAQLLEGSLSHVNPDTPLDDQVELLPYALKWEFPENSLFLEKQIGCGHFGRVLKARAIGIIPSLPSQSIEVAVKMVKSRCDLIELKSLIGELKILVHLGSHLNVVNLLGAVTKNIEKGTLMVIVEYCRNGNLKDYLINNRSSFVNELGDNGNMKPSISEISGSAAEKRRLHKKCFNNKTGSGETRSSTITTSDLIEWSFEIASGMNYLTQKKVIHGDLAARNVLLNDDNVVKIADFGLARKFYQDPNYHKKGKEPLPVKWMAIESIKDRVFSSKSDVWSFGITLWELFSLGQEPYVGIEHSQLLHCLLAGFRLGKPSYAPRIIGDLMSSCWEANPDERLTFDRYEQALGSLIDPDLLAQYKMPYDRFGYIIIPNSASQAAISENQQVEDIPHGYLEITNSNVINQQTTPFKSDIASVLLNTSPYFFSDIHDTSTSTDFVTDGSNNTMLPTNSDSIEMKCVRETQLTRKGSKKSDDDVLSIGYVEFETHA